MPPKSKVKKADKAKVVLEFTVNDVHYRMDKDEVSDRDEIALFRQSGLVLADLGAVLVASAEADREPPRFLLAGIMFLARRQAGVKVSFDWCSEQLANITELSFGAPDGDEAAGDAEVAKRPEA